MIAKLTNLPLTLLNKGDKYLGLPTKNPNSRKGVRSPRHVWIANELLIVIN
jgi:hypothetical protein